ncbi:hypothetical protein WT08_13855 [Burkholderia sp. MSMB1552]|nr:hypothetical protein WT08_13855 [Burkholderia sp. MSMB1552]KWZ55061.1 hypothetical protein WS92_03400 [Burkholderia sp. MSMB1588]
MAKRSRSEHAVRAMPSVTAKPIVMTRRPRTPRRGFADVRAMRTAKKPVRFRTGSLSSIGRRRGPRGIGCRAVQPRPTCFALMTASDTFDGVSA